MKLYQINESIEKILLVAEDAEGELTDGQLAELTALEMEFPRKVEAVGMFIRGLEVQAEGIKGESQRLGKRASTLENKARGLKGYLLAQMVEGKVQKVEGEVLSVRRQANPPSVNVLTEAAIPKDFMFQPPAVPDKKLILDALKAGTEVPGCELRRGEHVRIT